MWKVKFRICISRIAWRKKALKGVPDFSFSLNHQEAIASHGLTRALIHTLTRVLSSQDLQAGCNAGFCAVIWMIRPSILCSGRRDDGFTSLAKRFAQPDLT
jgi:hypothetical protein